MPLPNFLFIGTGRAGSTSLNQYLKQHPDIFMSPIKETNFFSYEGGRPNFRGPGDLQSFAHRQTITTFEAYQANFNAVDGQPLIGEASPSYLFVPQAPERIKHYLPNVKMIVILRDPVERAFSMFSGLVKQGREPLYNFEQAIEAEDERIRQNWAPTWHYSSQGFYYQQLKRYFELFDREQFSIHLFEEWVNDTPGVVREILQFLEADESFKIDFSEKYNVSGKPKSIFLQNFLERSNPVKTALKNVLPKQLYKYVGSNLKMINLSKIDRPTQAARQKLLQIYEQDILNLQDLIRKDLSSWLK